jgi:hypothetical protein
VSYDPGLLPGFLATAVTAEIEGLRWSDPGARAAMARRIDLEQDADAVLYGGKGCGKAFARFARALALLAYQPGGVRFGPLSWCAAHPRERWADGPICPACLREERQAVAGTESASA